MPKESEKVNVEVDGHHLQLSNLHKVLYPQTGFTKGAVIDYYTRIAPVLLPHLADRALTIKRYPNGVDENDRNCLPYGQPWNLYQSAPIDIVQDERETTMIYEDRALPWHVYTDGRPQSPTAKPTLNGHSVGHWEGDEFVVDTVAFAPRAAHGALMVLPNNETTHVVLRLRKSADDKEH